MKRIRWVALAVLPVAAIWIFVVSQSLRSLLSTLALGQQALRVESSVAAPAERSQLGALEDAGAASETSRTTPPEQPIHVDSDALRAADMLPPAVYADEMPATREAELVHPEITDPHLRRLLRPAWED